MNAKSSKDILSTIKFSFQLKLCTILTIKENFYLYFSETLSLLELKFSRSRFQPAPDLLDLAVTTEMIEDSMQLELI